MKTAIVFCSSVLATSTVASWVGATTYYAKVGGTGSTCGTTTECSVATAAGKAVAGDTVILRDGNYGKTYLSPANSGNANGWITFQADAGALPIFEGAGVGNSTSQYIRYVGIVSRYGSSGGFGNGWISGCNNNTSTSNGYLQYINCIADGNGINGIAHYCATGLLIQQSILAHNGNGPDSWSSAVNLYGVTGGTTANIVRDTIAFDTIDTSSTHSTSGKATDGSGFILDAGSKGATFINNVGFENGGSCIRLTNSSNSLLVNNTCYGNAKDPLAQYNDEILYSDATSRTAASLLNNVIVVTTTGKNAIGNATGITQTNNVTNAAASNFVSVPGATNVDFNLTSSATSLIDKGTTGNAPTSDIGFDPKCIKKGTLTGTLPSWLSTVPSWWTYVVDYEYIKSIGGVAKCFSPRTRTTTPDIGAFEYEGTPSGTGGEPGVGGASGTGGATATGGATGGATTKATGGVSSSGGFTSTGGMKGTTGGFTSVYMGSGGIFGVTGGSAGIGGFPNGATGGKVNATTGGNLNATGGQAIALTGGANAMGGGANGTGGQLASVGGANATGGSLGVESAGAGDTGGSGTSSDVGSCSCRLPVTRSNSASLAGFALTGLLLMRTRFRKQSAHTRVSVP